MTPLEHITGLIDHSYSRDIREAMARGILDKHAHELAEKIRDQVGGDPIGEWAQGVEDGRTSAADLIDPKGAR